jgi:hypothetical protein
MGSYVYNPYCCRHCKNEVWANKNYCLLNKKLKLEKYIGTIKRHPKCPLKAQETGNENN